QEGTWTSKKNDMFLLISQRLSATTVTEKGTLLENADLEGIKGEDLMVTMAGAMHQQLNLHHSQLCFDVEPNYDTEREKHNKAKLEIRGYEIALESLEARILGNEKNELDWGERY
ncbi:hypothetical protein Tco_0207626, partial [Tanacetum coccineum]